MYDSLNTFFSRATGTPRVSEHPWPEQHSKGGGVILHTEYQISISVGYEPDVAQLIEYEYNRALALTEMLMISVGDTYINRSKMLHKIKMKFANNHF